MIGPRRTCVHKSMCIFQFRSFRFDVRFIVKLISMRMDMYRGLRFHDEVTWGLETTAKQVYIDMYMYIQTYIARRASLVGNDLSVEGRPLCCPPGGLVVSACLRDMAGGARSLCCLAQAVGLHVDIVRVSCLVFALGIAHGGPGAATCMAWRVSARTPIGSVGWQGHPPSVSRVQERQRRLPWALSSLTRSDWRHKLMRRSSGRSLHRPDRRKPGGAG